MRCDLDKMLIMLDLSAARFRALSELDAAGGTYVGQLARLCFVRVPPMVRMLERMHERQIVQLSKPQPRGRVRNVRLTDLGRALLRSAQEWVGDVDQRLLSRLSEAEQQELERLLQVCRLGLVSDPVPEPEFE